MRRLPDAPLRVQLAMLRRLIGGLGLAIAGGLMLAPSHQPAPADPFAQTAAPAGGAFVRWFGAEHAPRAEKPLAALVILLGVALVASGVRKAAAIRRWRREAALPPPPDAPITP